VRFTKDENDRRKTDRFAIERDVRYKVITKKNPAQAAVGKTIDISSSGILFATDESLMVNKLVELSVSWPVQLNSNVALRFVARGRVVRCDGGQAAIEIQQHEFRTQGTLSVPVLR
jgi:hypothetical protein